MLTRGLHTGQLPTSHGLRTARPRPGRVSPCRSRRDSAFSGRDEDGEVLENMLRKGLNELPKAIASWKDSTDGAAWREKMRGWEQTMDNAERAYASAGDNTAPGERVWPYGSKPLRRFRKESSEQTVVAIDVEEYPDSYALWMDVPGLEKSDIKIQVSPTMRTMTISGERKRATSAEPTGRVRHERRMGSFSRVVRLAKDMDISTTTAKVDRGVLHVTARKFPVVEPEDDSMEIPID